MPRNNEDRFENLSGAEETPTQNVNPLLNFVIPTEFVELPTKGKFYPLEHPLHNVETIEIKYMTAKETDLLTSTSLLKKGIAIDRMLQNIIVDGEIRVEDLFVGDKNALIMAARVSGFGEEYEAAVSCLSCANSSRQNFDLSDMKVKESPENTDFSENGTFFITLPQTNVNAECRLLTSSDEKKLMAMSEKKQKLKLAETNLTDQLKFFIVSLNGVTDRSVVDEFVDLMPASDSNFLRKKYEEFRPDVDLSYVYECESCSAVNNVEIPFTTTFFWPR